MSAIKFVSLCCEIWLTNADQVHVRPYCENTITFYTMRWNMTPWCDVLYNDLQRDIFDLIYPFYNNIPKRAIMVSCRNFFWYVFYFDRSYVKNVFCIICKTESCFSILQRKPCFVSQLRSWITISILLQGPKMKNL